MRTYSPGDLVTFPLRGDMYGVAQLVHRDDLALHELFHFVICDVVVAGKHVDGTDEFGGTIEREHDVDAVEAATSLIEHIGVTRHGLEASDLSVVSSRDVEEIDLRGYHMWLHLRYRDAVSRGVIRDRVDDNPEEQFDDDDVASGDDADVDAQAETTDDIDVENARSETADSNEAADTAGSNQQVDAEPEALIDPNDPEELAGTSTLGVHDIALGDALIRQRAVFEREQYRDSELARFIIGLADDHGAINAIVQRMLDGDFVAGEELLDYGEAGMRALANALNPDIEPEIAEDILQILVNSGETIAYECVGDFMAAHGTRNNDPLSGPAVRSYCYAVMLTTGEPEGLKKHLSLLDAVVDPELADDVRSAKEALIGED